MAANKRITDLTDYLSVLPYASELFGVYQPLLGWRSKQRIRQINWGVLGEGRRKIFDMIRLYEPIADVRFNADFFPELNRFEVGRPGLTGRTGSPGLLYDEMNKKIRGGNPSDDDLRGLLDEGRLREILNGPVFTTYRTEFQAASRGAGANRTKQERDFISHLREESSFAGLLVGLANKGRFDEIRRLFSSTELRQERLDRALASTVPNFEDPFLTFDPTKEIKDVILSPLGFVHLYRQFFFELDSFVGTPVGHVWLSPGSTVELSAPSSAL